jgi:hypothetical protein
MRTLDLSPAGASSCPNAGKYIIGNNKTQNQCDLIMINLGFVFSFPVLDHRGLSKSKACCDNPQNHWLRVHLFSLSCLV